MKYGVRTIWMAGALGALGVMAAGCGDSGMLDGGSVDFTIPTKTDMPPHTGDMPLGPDIAVTGDIAVPGDASTNDSSVLDDMAMAQQDGGSDGIIVGPDGGSDGIIQGTDGGGADSGPVACGNTQQSCGKAGSCIDCTGNTVGVACVAMVCGCNTSADCLKGYACDPNAHTCSTGCANGLTCNGGCCDGKACQMGNINGACGSSGGACAACGNGTPTCTAGACTGNCVVGGANGGNCGVGFCCGANSTCLAVANPSCGVSGAACIDCSKSPNGPTCLMSGTCGCGTSADCPVGQACKAGVCGAVCDMNTPCNGGCCSANRCVTGNTQTACSVGGASCASCAGNMSGSACVTENNKTFCGCKVSADCTAGHACDLATNQCTTKCDVNNPCNGGCCSAAQNGTCQGGTSGVACGANGGVCGACADPMNPNTNGHVCVAVQGGGQCGCNQLSDCPISATRCDGGKKICVNICSDVDKCQFGCCSAHQNGTCETGTANGECGVTGTCSNCTVTAMGHLCRAMGVCGCDKSSDCQLGESCDLGAHACTTKCSMTQACNGGCCSAAQNGTCLAGTMPNACGAANTCLDCSASVSGHTCIQGASCGCNSSQDCGALQACNVAAHVCTNKCTPDQLCNGGCCQGGICADGKTNNSACGKNGGACATCVNAMPTCQAGSCTAKCGGPNDGTCNGGTCCANFLCVTGTAENTCGFSGACANCSNSSKGTKCETPNGGPYYCGCDAKSDCLAANPKAEISGYACDTANHNCTSLCGFQGVTLCNGGCCSGPNGQCRSGSADNACGQNGAFCSSCADSCNPGPKCEANGSCGCTAELDCYNNTYFSGSCGSMGNGRLGCNLGSGSCCFAGGFSPGDAALCCTGAVDKAGKCTCVANGAPAINGDQSSCCSLLAANNGVCTGRPSCDPGFGPCTTANTCYRNSDCATNDCVSIQGPIAVCCDPAGTPCNGGGTCCSSSCNGDTGKCD